MNVGFEREERHLIIGIGDLTYTITNSHDFMEHGS